MLDAAAEVSHTRTSLATRILRLSGGDALHEPAEIPGLTIVRLDQPLLNTCSVYEPCVGLIVQGSKRIFLGDDTLSYGVDRYLIASMDLPVRTAVVDASPDRPYLGLVLRLDWREIASLVLELPAAAPAKAVPGGRAMTTGAISAPLLDAFDRLLALLERPQHIRSLAPLIQREIHYWLLAGEAGDRLRQIATVDTQSHQVVRAIGQLNERFTEPLRVESLARTSGMSQSTFHHHFKALTAMSPLQYQKQLRLTEARRLMLSEHLDASTAAFRVGYESPSQFSREYRRLFGAPPSKDMAEMRHQLDSPVA